MSFQYGLNHRPAHQSDAAHAAAAAQTPPCPMQGIQQTDGHFVQNHYW